MIDFLKDETKCKGRAVQEYFGEETSASCGHCSVCRKELKSVAPLADIRTKILEQLDSTAVPMSQLTSCFPEDARPALISTLRNMVERGQVVWHPDNSFSLPKKKTR